MANYQCPICNKSHATVEDMYNCMSVCLVKKKEAQKEAERLAAEKKQAELRKEKEARYSEIDAKFNELRILVEKYDKDYDKNITITISNNVPLSWPFSWENLF